MKKLKFSICILLILIVNTVFSQTFLLSGIVKDSISLLPGATIINKTIKAGILADSDGKFSIKAKIGDTLSISYLGKIDFKLKVENDSFLSIILKDGPIIIKEILPYENQRRKKVVYCGTGLIENRNANASKTIYLLGGWASVITEKEIVFSKKYNIQFHDFGCIHPENTEEYEQLNWQTFNYLNERFGKKWQQEINLNTLGFQNWLKK